MFETVSAFANTRGGWLVLGITQEGERFEVSGVGEPDKLQNDFLSVLHADGKVSHDVEITEHRYAHEGKVVLAFHIAENPRTRKPVDLDGDIRRTFLRKGGGGYRAQPHEIERMLRDQSADRWDGQPFTRVSLSRRRSTRRASSGIGTDSTPRIPASTWSSRTTSSSMTGAIS